MCIPIDGSMSPMTKSLLDQIEAVALDGNVVKALRLCITLGGRASSAELRRWASHELRGYGADSQLPDYRCIQALLCVDGVTASAKITGQYISVLDLPDVAREFVSEQLELRHSIPALYEMVRDAERQGSSVRLSPPGAAEITSLMNSDSMTVGYINSLYWNIAPTTIKDVIERVCTDIIALVSEMRAGMSHGQQVPSHTIASQAFGVVIEGDNNRVTVRDTHQGDHSVNSANGRAPSIKIAWWIAGIVSMVGGLIIAFLQISG